ncbi:MAG: HAD-IC family P-type ATPase [Clostridia bacterium]|jgi:Mg2+-importing ATPase|nr:HAD-IC family P-type ATPase [Clostridia bacterium]
MIPADLRIIESKDLYVGQSSLTGESDSVRKLSDSENSFEEMDSILDLDTICFMGTNVISGSAKGVVIKVANSTYFGKIARSVNTSKPKTSFQKGIENISRLLIRFMILIIPIIFILNAWKHNLLTAFTFAVAVAITITPLLLPVILSSCLSKGAVRMSKKKTIVKKLDSIQNFGAMNILCTDKTGTLTEDRIVLEKYLNASGEQDDDILRYAYLNAAFQTGLKGNIDEAIIKRAKENGITELQNSFRKIDEIPFDFSRRRLSVIVENDKKEIRMITKGAIEEILNICTMVKIHGKFINITDTIRKNVLEISRNLNKDGLRIVGICEKKDLSEEQAFSVDDEKEMIFLGFVGFLDPPKESAKESIQKLNKSGIRVIVLTGDNTFVTKAICDKVGINTKEIIEGSQIDRLPDMGVARLLKKNNIFAKLSPIQKARIVRILKDMGNVVRIYGRWY